VSVVCYCRCIAFCCILIAVCFFFSSRRRHTRWEHFLKTLAEPDALKLALLALYNAADDDVGTGGPDLVRGIYPTAKIVNAAGITDVSDQQIRGIYDGLIATRRSKEN